jgi:hypothetical protein
MMRKLLAILFLLVFTLSNANAQSFNFDGLSNDELIEMQARIITELSIRQGAKNIEMPAGTYTAGVDFPSGTYSVKTKGFFVQFLLYQDANDMQIILDQTDDFLKSFSRMKQHILDDENGIGKIVIEDGNILNIIGGTIHLSPYSGLKID